MGREREALPPLLGFEYLSIYLTKKFKNGS